MKVLIIGGMGVIGGAITEAAAKNGMDVFVCSRRPLFGKYFNLKVKGIQGDWRDDCVAKCIVADNFDVIVDTQIFTKKQLIRSLNIVNGHCKQFVYISTDSVYVHPAKDKTEDEPIDLKKLKWKYGFDKRDAELYLSHYGNNYSFYWTVIRPTVTFGDTRLPVGFASKRDTNTLVNRILDGKPVILFDDINTKHSICHTSIFGSAVANLFLNENAKNQAFHVSDDKAYTYLEVFHTIEDILGIKGNYVHLSSRYLKKYNKNIYEEMIYDKNPEFTLDNSKIKTVSPTTNYHPDIYEILKPTVLRLKQSSEIDVEYDMLTDLLLLQHKKVIKDASEKDIAEKYLASLAPEYKTELKHYGLSVITQTALKPVKRFCLLPFRIGRKICRLLIKKSHKSSLCEKRYGGYNDYTDKQGGAAKNRIWTGFVGICPKFEKKKRSLIVA